MQKEVAGYMRLALPVFSRLQINRERSQEGRTGCKAVCEQSLKKCRQRITKLASFWGGSVRVSFRRPICAPSGAHAVGRFDMSTDAQGNPRRIAAILAQPWLLLSSLRLSWRHASPASSIPPAMPVFNKYLRGPSPSCVISVP
jgi:hypothetical protein